MARSASADRNRRTTAATLVAVALAFVLTACGGHQEFRSVAVDPNQVTRIEMTFSHWYPKGAAGSVEPDRHTTITDPLLIQKLVREFSAVPVTGVGNAWDRAAGAQSTAMHITLENGSSLDLKQVYIAAKDVIIVWSDGTQSHTKRGAPLVDTYYDPKQG